MATQLTVEDVGKMKVAELKSELSARDLSTKGLKKELAERLTEALEQQEEQAQEEEEEQVPQEPQEEGHNGTTIPESDPSAETSGEAPEIADGIEKETDNLPSELPSLPPVTTEPSVQDYEGTEATLTEQDGTNAQSQQKGLQVSDVPSEVVKPPVDHLDKTPGFVASSEASQTTTTSAQKRKREAGEDRGEAAQANAQPAPVEAVAVQEELAEPPNDAVPVPPAVVTENEPEAKRVRTEGVLSPSRAADSTEARTTGLSIKGAGAGGAAAALQEDSSATTTVQNGASALEYSIKGLGGKSSQKEDLEKQDSATANPPSLTIRGSSSATATRESSNAAAAAAAAAAATEAGPSDRSGPAPSPSICLSNLVRPFTLPALKDLLADYGTYSYFWINFVKSHCFVTYDDVHSAASAADSLNGKVWPDAVGKALTVTYVPSDVVGTLVQKEEAAGRTRLELSVERDDTRGEWQYDVLPPSAIPAGSLSSSSSAVGPGRAAGAAVPRGLASSVPLQARVGAVTSNPFPLGRPDQPPADPNLARAGHAALNSRLAPPLAATTALARNGSSTSSMVAQASTTGPSRGPVSPSPSSSTWLPAAHAEPSYRLTKAQPPLYYKPVDIVAAGRRLRELERASRQGGGSGRPAARPPARPMPRGIRDSYRP